MLVVIQNTPETSSIAAARMGLAIAKKRARRAVDRNRLKRQVRESFRQQGTNLGLVDVVVMNRDAAAQATPAELRRKLDELWRQIADFSAKAAVKGSEQERA